ncbi:MAG: hypothetical protein ABFR97_09420 [Thermodesulfobacteriota bacterium]
MQHRSVSSPVALLGSQLLVALLLITCLPAVSFALTPIARYDVVPHQRISRGETFNLGVIAFSKAGIREVRFNISGPGYNGGSKSATTMTYNSRTNVHEYWVPLSAREFSGDGAITVRATVYGKDNDSRQLENLPLIINASGNLAQPKAWVSNRGNDNNGAVNNRAQPFATVGAAVGAIQARNGGRSDGAIIYFEEGSYGLGSGTISTRNEWLTLTRAAGAAKERTIINNGGGITRTNLIKASGLTLTSSGTGDHVFRNDPATLWVDSCRLIGSGRHRNGSNPVYRGGQRAEEHPAYYTDSYITNADFGVHMGTMARGLTIERIGNDAFQNTLFLVNIRVDDMDPGPTYWHADAYQSFGNGPENRIIYNFYGTNLHYQGLFMREENNTPARNNAFVNIFMEMREPGRPGSSGGKVVLTNGAMYGVWDHVLVWHVTMPTSHFSINSEGIGRRFTNASFVGNVFYQFRENVTKSGGEPDYTMPGNSGNNEYLYNHFINSCVDQGNCSESPRHWYSKSPDSASQGSQSLGNPRLSLNNPASADYGAPLSGSPLIDRIPFATVPADLNGKLRDGRPDIGAIEGGSGQGGATCSNTHLYLCTTQASCEGANGFWWSDKQCRGVAEEQQRPGALERPTPGGVMWQK